MKENSTTQQSEEVDAYIRGFPEKHRLLLEKMRETIRAAVPGASEIMSYRMPACKINGVLVYYAAFKNHIGFYPTSSGVQVFKSRLTAYKTSKGAIQFPIGQPLPTELITEIVQFREQEDLLKRSCCP